MLKVVRRIEDALAILGASNPGFEMLD